MSNKYETELLTLIDKWITANFLLRDITRYLYNHTEYFESEYERNFNEPLHSFFARKLTQYTKNFRELDKLISFEQRKKLDYINLIERNI